MKPVYIEVDAGVQYWEDATVNGVEDEDGSRIPFRAVDRWRPVIRLADGLVLNWPHGTTADVHYKVCDDGEYHLQDEGRKRVGTWNGGYVPDEFLCHGDDGYGDYIIFTIRADGFVESWKSPHIDISEWGPRG